MTEVAGATPPQAAPSEATVAQTWMYPVKSMQGVRTASLQVEHRGVVGDRNWALLDLDSGRILSAKRVGALLDAVFDAGVMVLPNGVRVDLEDLADGGVGPDGVCAEISEWLGKRVRVCSVDDISAVADGPLSYQMTFDPPDDDSEYYDIPMPEGSFVDLAPLHLLTTATLNGCAAARPDLDWDVRRFRPNLLVDTEGDIFTESTWIGRKIRIGKDLVVRPSQPTVRCAMPLRHQPELGVDEPELVRQPALYRAMNELRPEMPNHLGVYVDVLEPGEVHVGDRLEFL